MVHVEIVKIVAADAYKTDPNIAKPVLERFAKVPGLLS